MSLIKIDKSKKKPVTKPNMRELLEALLLKDDVEHGAEAQVVLAEYKQAIKDEKKANNAKTNRSKGGHK